MSTACRHDKLGFGHSHKHHEFFGASVTRHMEIRGNVRVRNIDPVTTEEIDEAINIAFIARDWVGGKDDFITWIEFDALVIACCDPLKRRAHLSLGAGDDQTLFVFGERGHLAFVDHDARRDSEEAELGGDLDVALDREADKGDFTIIALGDPESLLDTTDIARHGGDYYPVVFITKLALKRLLDDSFGEGITGLFRAEAVREEEDYPFSSSARHGLDIGELLTDGGPVKFEVRTMVDIAERGFDDQMFGIGDRVGDWDELDFKIPKHDGLAIFDDI